MELEIASLREMLTHFEKFEESYDTREAVFASVCLEVLATADRLGILRDLGSSKASLAIKEAITRAVKESEGGDS